MKAVTDCITRRCKLEYLPVIPLPPHDNVVKWYMDMIQKMLDQLEIDHIFLHADQAIHSKVLIIQWLTQGKYDQIITFLGGFHTIMVNLKIPGKKYSCLGLKEWWMKADVIAQGSADQAMEGRHYHRSIRLHKHAFEALLRYRMKGIPNKGEFTPGFKRQIVNWRLVQSTANLKSITNSPEFKQMANNLTGVFGTQAQMMMQYIRDVSAMLCFVSAVRENTIERHLAAERVFLPKFFAFLQNYARYLTFQHVKLQEIRSKQEGAWYDLLVNGFGGSVSGKPYLTIHVDLITETTINSEVKVRRGPMQGGFSTDEKAVDTCVKTSHIMATVWAKLKERLDVLTQSVHKETTVSAIKKHEAMIEGLVLQLDKYFDPFLDGPAGHFKTGAEIEPSVIEGLLNSSAVGEAMYAEVIDERLKAKENRVSIFASIKILGLKLAWSGQKRFPKP